MTHESDTLILEDFLPYRLSILSNIVSASIASLYADRFVLTIPGWRIMAVLGRFPGLSAAEVAERTAMDKVAVSRAVSGLLEAGYITRAFANEDRRRSELALSRQGKEVYSEVVPLALDYEKKLLESLTPEDRETFGRLTGELLARADKLVAQLASS